MDLFKGSIVISNSDSCFFSFRCRHDESCESVFKISHSPMSNKIGAPLK